MECPSILNDVLGPVMRGPSSSHTAGSFQIGRLARSLLGAPPSSAVLCFDPQGSYVRTYREQGADRAFAAGLLGWDITDPRFSDALEQAERSGLTLEFLTGKLEGADHPNTVRIVLRSRDGRELGATAKSTGGGGFVFSDIDGCRASLNGKSFGLLVLADPDAAAAVEDGILASIGGPGALKSGGRGGVLLTFRRTHPFDDKAVDALISRPGVKIVRRCEPVYFVGRGEALFVDAAGMVEASERNGWSLGEAALAYESRILGFSRERILSEILARYRIMEAAVELGFDDANVHMKLLGPTARGLLEAEAGGRLAVGGPHARAAARAMAALHTSNSGGIVCAAPTGASSGVIPGVLATLAEEKALADRSIALALLAAGAVGLVVMRRATFAAEVAGCQVEIGAAGAMAAAAVVEAAGGNARRALDAAAISFQNTMGSVCDLVQGFCEIPCHTRNAAAASAAITAADLILGGYANPVPLDETVDAVFATGLMLPCELRCTARGGLAMAPSARNLAVRTEHAVKRT